MASLNRVMLIGRLGRDPELKYTQSGNAVCSFSIATTEKYNDQEKTEWHKIIMFGKLAELAEKYLEKGREVFIEGKIQTRTYDKDGQTHYVTEIVALGMQFIGSKQESKPDPKPSKKTEEPAEDDIPF